MAGYVMRKLTGRPWVSASSLAVMPAFSRGRDARNQSIKIPDRAPQDPEKAKDVERGTPAVTHPGWAQRATGQMRRPS